VWKLAALLSFEQVKQCAKSMQARGGSAGMAILQLECGEEKGQISFRG
jgi:hypothetical protein